MAAAASGAADALVGVTGNGVTGRGRAGGLRRRLSGRPDREHEMVINRLAISTLLMIYLIGYSLTHGMVIDDPLLANAVYMMASLGFFIHILVWPQVSHARRIVGQITDIGALTYCLYVGGATTAVLFPIYLWIDFGNGFRFGLRYLFSATALGLAGFGFLLAASDYWSATGLLGYGLLAGLLVLPAYTSTLIRNLNKARQQAEDASKGKTLFLASVSHELRTPLNAVIGMGDLLVDTRLDDEQRDMVGTIGVSARALLSMIEELLNFARIEAGQLRLERVDFDLFATLAQARAMLSPAARSKGLRLGLHVDSGLPQVVNGDARHVRELLINLVGNAVKFTAQGHVLVEGFRVRADDGGLRIRFEVSDTGIGIAPEARGRIFESFTQADETILNRFGGTGLGLAICKQLVEALGGAIGVESELGAGSTFWFELPFGTVDAEPALPDGLSAVLLSPDSGAARTALAPAVGELGIRVCVAATIPAAQGALARIAAETGRRPVLVADGRAMMLAARLADAAGSDTVPPAIVLLRSPDGPKPDAAARARFVAALQAPVTPRALSAALRIATAGESRSGPMPVARDAGGALRKLSILVADDNRTNQRVLAKMLERGGHRATLADHGEAAVDAMLAQRFDLVFMDVNMPVLNGTEATKLYRFAALGRPHLPIIALTADATDEARRLCLEAGMDGCVTKPIEAAKLYALLATIAGSAPAEPSQDEIYPPADIPGLDPSAGSRVRSPASPDPRDDVRPIEDDERGLKDDVREIADARPQAADAAEIVTDIASHPRFCADVPAIDPATAERLRELGGAEFLHELAAEFLAEAATILAEIADSVAAGDAALFRDRTHALRSGAANIGALQLYEDCLAVRDIASAELAERGGTILTDLAAEFGRVRRALDTLGSASEPHDRIVSLRGG